MNGMESRKLVYSIWLRSGSACSCAQHTWRQTWGGITSSNLNVWWSSRLIIDDLLAFSQVIWLFSQFEILLFWPAERHKRMSRSCIPTFNTSVVSWIVILLGNTSAQRSKWVSCYHDRASCCGSPVILSSLARRATSPRWSSSTGADDDIPDPKSHTEQDDSLLLNATDAKWLTKTHV